ncbi:Integrase catalytic core [Arabidopsis thaliana x Arabidopsis arenosa]|uniref:Integrase catalytic core n=1 Tax=Arabidopsis thaliana x Arabidopsis arenosa TaxID=1240361 RepID=A0A8T2B035_9BRAS|nr:Integrase catalytic core [Arabidopsis thaliana x Arabidopsis arenosa]
MREVFDDGVGCKIKHTDFQIKRHAETDTVMKCEIDCVWLDTKGMVSRHSNTQVEKQARSGNLVLWVSIRSLLVVTEAEDPFATFRGCGCDQQNLSGCGNRDAKITTISKRRKHWGCVTPTTTGLKHKTISPYDLSANDNPGAIISQPLLNGLNYDEWALNFRMALSSRKKFGFLDGSISKPAAASPELEDWTANNHLIVGWIKQTIEPKIRSTISTREVAKDLWDIIKKRFSIKSGARLQQLRNSLANCKQNGSTVDEYFGRLTKLWDGISDCMSSKRCSCGKCECDLNTARDKELETLRIHDFLAGLDDSIHGVVRSQICAISPLPDLDTVYQTVSQNETIHSTATTEVPVMGFAAQVPSSPHPGTVQTRDLTRQFTNYAGGSRFVPGNRDPNRKCTSCGRMGHEASSCFKVVGYPEWWGDRPRNRGDTRSSQGFSAGRGRGSNPRANVSQIVTANAAAIDSSEITDSDRQGLTGLSDDQWKIVKKMINTGKASDQLSGKKSDISWILDTGATHHMTGRSDLMMDIRDIASVSVLLPAGADVVSTKQGTVRLTPTLSLHNVYLINGFHTNLISFGQLVTDNFLVGQVTNRLMILQDRITRTLIGSGEREGEGLYRFRGINSVSSMQANVRDDSILWHHRLGHPSSRITGMIPGVSSLLNNHSEDLIKKCEVCFRAKQTRQCFPDSSNNAKAVFDLIHLDLWGPYRTTAFCGSRYFLTIVDDYSRAVWLYLLPDKTRVSQRIRDFLAMIERQFNKRVKSIRSDNGTEFMCLTRFFQEQGILHETSCVHTPQQNGRAERKHRHILNVARALRFHANLPIDYWGECILNAGYLINRTPSILLNGETPFERLYGHAPSYSHLRVFGCLAYAHNIDHRGDKFATRSRRCVFLGYPYGKKGWKLFDLDREIFFVSRDVVFQEDVFPLSAKIPSSASPAPVVTTPVSHNNLPDDDPIAFIPAGDVHGNDSGPSDPILVSPPTSPRSPSTQNSPATKLTSPVQTTPVIEDVPTTSAVEELGPGKRKITPNVRLSDYVVGTATITPSSSLSPLSPVPQQPSGAVYPISDYVSYEQFTPQHRCFLTALSQNIEPRSFREAMAYEVWRNAMGSEIDALQRNHTWDLEELPPDKKALGSKWVFTIKFRSDGTIERHKARLVVLGNHQTEGIDYTETFSPVAKMTTVRMFLDFAAKKNHEVHQMDVHNAFLHGDLHEEVYMKLPQGFSTPNETRVCRLRKSLYGLKQAPRCWFAKLTAALIKYGFSQAPSDYSLFVYSKNGISLRILVYVDDLIISGNKPEEIKIFKEYLATCFHMKDLGFLKYFLGLEVSRNAKGIYVCQRKYASDIVTETGLLGCKPAGSPMDQNHRLGLATGPVLADPESYRRLVGRLIYLIATRPDLTYAVHILSRFMQTPRQEHWLAALKVVRYLKGTLGQGILLRADSSFHLTGWCDSDWQACPLSRRSISGWIVQLGSSIISWKAKKQDMVSMSSAEAEYRAMNAVTKELKWLKSLLYDLGVDHIEPMTIKCDSKAAIHISLNPVFHERTKHIERDCHFVRDEIVRRVVKPEHVYTEDQLADILTKALGRKEFDAFLLKLGIQDLHAPT